MVVYFPSVLSQVYLFTLVCHAHVSVDSHMLDLGGVCLSVCLAVVVAGVKW